MAHKYPTATAGKIVSVHYIGTFDSGTEFDNSYSRGKPITFEVGTSQMMAGFDQAVVGLAVGDKKSFKLTPDFAYGEVNEKLFQTFTISDFPADFELTVGEMISIPTEAGQAFPATVYTKDEQDVVLNFNHPMAGKTLNFDVEVVAVIKKEITEEETYGETSTDETETRED